MREPIRSIGIINSKPYFWHTPCITTLQDVRCPGGCRVKISRRAACVWRDFCIFTRMKYPFSQSDAGNITVVATNNMLVIFIRSGDDVTSYIVANPGNSGVFGHCILEVDINQNDTPDEMLEKIDAVVKENMKKVFLQQ